MTGAAETDHVSLPSLREALAELTSALRTDKVQRYEPNAQLSDKRKATQRLDAAWRTLDAIAQALEAQPQGVPTEPLATASEGWTLAPAKATKAMRRAGADVWATHSGSFNQVTGAMYDAMLAIAPRKPPSATQADPMAVSASLPATANNT